MATDFFCPDAWPKCGKIVQASLLWIPPKCLMTAIPGGIGQIACWWSIRRKPRTLDTFLPGSGLDLKVQHQTMLKCNWPSYALHCNCCGTSECFSGEHPLLPFPLHQQSCNFCLVNLVYLSWCYFCFHQGVLTWRQCPLNETGTGIATIHGVEVCQSTGSSECSKKCLFQTFVRLSLPKNKCHGIKNGKSTKHKDPTLPIHCKLLDPILCHNCFCPTSWK